MGGPDWSVLLRGEVMLTDLLSLVSKEGNNHLPPKRVQPGTFCHHRHRPSSTRPLRHCRRRGEHSSKGCGMQPRGELRLLILSADRLQHRLRRRRRARDQPQTHPMTLAPPTPTTPRSNQPGARSDTQILSRMTRDSSQEETSRRSSTTCPPRPAHRHHTDLRAAWSMGKKRPSSSNEHGATRSLNPRMHFTDISGRRSIMWSTTTLRSC